MSVDLNKTLQLAFENHKAGNLNQAKLLYKNILSEQANDVDALHLLGVLYHQQGEYDDATKSIKRAIALDPHFAEAYNNLGNIMRDKELIDEAKNYYQKALELDPNLAIAYNNLGNLYIEKKLLDKAIPLLNKALQINPNFAEAYNTLGRVHAEKGMHNEAIVCFQRAIQLNSKFASAYNNLGMELIEKNLHDEAISCFQKALEYNPDLSTAYSNLVDEMQRTCNWEQFNNSTKKAMDSGEKHLGGPFMAVSRYTDLSINYNIAKNCSQNIAKAVSILKNHFSFHDRKENKSRIIIGYLSNDFMNHATAHLILSLFRLHSRDAFRVYCYSYGKDDGSHYRKIIQNDCDKFVDISSYHYAHAARCIYEDNVDILIDLKGYTKGSRLKHARSVQHLFRLLISDFRALQERNFSTT